MRPRAIPEMRAPSPPGCAPRRCRGVGLLEVLVTVVILSVGILGIAALQFQSKRLQHEAIQRTYAAMLAHDILERLRANPSELPAAPVVVGGGTVGAEPTPTCVGLASQCTAFQLYQHDLWEWEQMMDGAAEVANGESLGGFVAPTGCITGPAGGGTGTYTVAIAWRGQTPVSDPAASTCGQGSGKYDDAEGNVDAYRRVLEVETYIDAG